MAATDPARRTGRHRRSLPARQAAVAAATVIAAVACGSDTAPQPSPGAAAGEANAASPGTTGDEPPVVDGERIDETATAGGTAQRHPDVVGVAAEQAADGTWRFDVTISSPYDTPERYADAWRVLGPDGTEFGVRVLTHDHAGEQPFTRSLGGVVVPADVDVVTIEGRDLHNGWGGETVTLELAR